MDRTLWTPTSKPMSHLAIVADVANLTRVVRSGLHVADVPGTNSNTVGGNLIRVQVPAPAPVLLCPTTDNPTIS